MVTVPFQTSTIPKMDFNMVDFPEPFGPMIQFTRSSETVTERSWRT